MIIRELEARIPGRLEGDIEYHNFFIFHHQFSGNACIFEVLDHSATLSMRLALAKPAGLPRIAKLCFFALGLLLKTQERLTQIITRTVKLVVLQFFLW